MRNERTKHFWIGLLSLTLAAPGCVSIRHKKEFGPNDFSPLQSHLNCGHCGPIEPQLQGCEDPCEVMDLHHPMDMAIPGLQPWVPVRNAASGMKNGASRICSSMLGLKDRMHARCSDWQSKRKEKDNPPPWPKFHPVPAKPVFEAQTGEMANAPEIFGAFGPASEE